MNKSTRKIIVVGLKHSLKFGDELAMRWDLLTSRLPCKGASCFVEGVPQGSPKGLENPANKAIGDVLAAFKMLLLARKMVLLNEINQQFAYYDEMIEICSRRENSKCVESLNAQIKELEEAGFKRQILKDAVFQAKEVQTMALLKFYSLRQALTSKEEQKLFPTANDKLVELAPGMCEWLLEQDESLDLSLITKSPQVFSIELKEFEDPDEFDKVKEYLTSIKDQLTAISDFLTVFNGHMLRHAKEIREQRWAEYILSTTSSDQPTIVVVGLLHLTLAELLRTDKSDVVISIEADDQETAEEILKRINKALKE